MELAVILLGAFCLDMLLGDPRLSCHPVALLGRLASASEHVSRRLLGDGRLAGAVCACFVYLVATGIAWSLAASAQCFGRWAGLATAAFLVYTTIAPRSLCAHAKAVEDMLRAHDLPGARGKVALIVSRDPEALDEPGIVRSCVESLGENLSDGVTAPLFYALLGWLLAGVPGAAAAAWLHRSANTLDAMFGYKNERYLRFGHFAARFDDLLNYLPARLTVLATALAALVLELRPLNAVRCAWRDHAKHPSPNSAWGMASFAGALGVQLGGRTKYATGWKDYPPWGDNLEPLAVKHIQAARHLVMLSTVVFMVLLILTQWSVTR